MSTDRVLLLIQTSLALLLVVVMVVLLLLPRGGMTGGAGARVVGADPERAAGGSLTLSADRITADLVSRPELIPYSGVLGGKMGFYDEDAIHVLSEDYVYAEFTDGHVQGSMVLEYEVDARERIRWRVLSATLDR
jgi:hypothetical protein